MDYQKKWGLDYFLDQCSTTSIVNGGYSLIIQLFTSTYLCTVFKQLLTVKVMNSLDILLLDFF